MSEKLEAKHISMYIPHGLVVQGRRHGGMHTYYEVTGLKGDRVVVRGAFAPNIPLKRVKPVLRPIEDIMNTISHDGFLIKPFNMLRALSKTGYHFNFSEKEMRKIIESGDLDMGKMPYWMVVQCVEWHFDVNNLIKRELALPMKSKL